MRRRTARHLSICAALVIGMLFSFAPPADAGHPPVGRDISYPQCAAALPRIGSGHFAVLGANGGRVFTKNRCLVSQLRWAKRMPGPPAFYANTGNPGPKRSKHWPIGQRKPFRCRASHPNSAGCSYDYGWNGARHSFALAARAAQRLHHVSRANARARAANVDWWLDVEIANSWQTLSIGNSRGARFRDVAAIGGAVGALWSVGVRRVGIYSTRYQWTLITGGRRITRDWFASIPVWLAGFTGHADAVAGCSAPSFTGGPVLMTQYLGRDGFDADVWCA